MKFKSIASLSITALVALTLSTERESRAVEIGPFDTESICNNIGTVGAVINAFQIVQWPVAGFPGTVIGLTMRDSPLLGLCDYINQVTQLDTANAIFLSANYLNNLTGNKWDSHLAQARRTYDISTSLFDFERGGLRSGLDAVSVASSLNDYLRETDSWQSKLSGKNWFPRSRQEEEERMRSVAEESFKVAKYTSALYCPVSGNTRVDDIVDDSIEREKSKDQEEKKLEAITKKTDGLRREINEAREDVDYFSRKLFEMGPRFVDNEIQYNTEYKLELQSVQTSVWFKNPEARSKEIKRRTKTGKTLKNKQGNSYAEKKIVTKKVPYYRYSTLSDNRHVDSFRKKWAPRWASFLKAKVASTGSGVGLFAWDKNGRNEAIKSVEQDFVDLDYECQENRLDAGLNASSPSYSADLKRLVDNCKNRASVSMAELNNLLDYYANNLFLSLNKLRRSEANLYSEESEHMGIHRMVQIDPKKENNQETSCDLQPAERDDLAVKIQASQAKLTETIAINSSREVSRADRMEEYAKEAARDHAQRSAMAEEQSKNAKIGLTRGMEGPHIPKPIKMGTGGR